MTEPQEEFPDVVTVPVFPDSDDDDRYRFSSTNSTPQKKKRQVAKRRKVAAHFAELPPVDRYVSESEGSDSSDH